MSGGMGGGEAGVDVEMLTTKGDTHGFDTDNARVPIGVSATVLTADSTKALGLAWAAPATPSSEFPIVLGNTSVAAGSTNATLNALTLTASPNISINASGKLRFDGGGDTYFQETASDILKLYVGGIEMANFTEGANNFTQFKNNVVIPSLSKLHLDGFVSGDTYIYESAANKISLVVNNIERANLTTTGVDILGVLTVNGVAVESTPLWKIIAFG